MDPTSPTCYFADIPADNQNAAALAAGLVVARLLADSPVAYGIAGVPGEDVAAGVAVANTVVDSPAAYNAAGVPAVGYNVAAGIPVGWFVVVE